MDQIRNGTKEMPKTARKFLNDVFSDSIKFHPPERGFLLGKTYCTAEIDGLEFRGEGDTVDEARERAALQVLECYLHLKFPFD